MSAEARKVVCILGSPVTADGKPLLHMRSRLDHALAALREGGWLAHHAIIVTGGRPKTYGSAGVHAEADVMRDYLVANGMPADRIIVDAVAYSTLDNAVNSKALLSAGGSPPPEELVVVTHDWHMERAKMLFEVVFADWCRDHGMRLVWENVPTDEGDPEVAERLVIEAHHRENVPKWLRSYGFNV